jgi:CHAD domain-containing protein
MTPGLAAFVVSDDVPQEPDHVVAAVMTALEQAFTILPEQGEPSIRAVGRGHGRAAGTPEGAMRGAGGTGQNHVGARQGTLIHRTWFDTFDWRLFRAGLLLEYVPARRGGQLCLTNSADSSDVIAQPVTGWLPSRPHPAGDLPAGPLADRVAGLIAPRTLLPIVTLTTATTVSRLLNEDAKTVARLILERPAVTAPATRAPGASQRDVSDPNASQRDGGARHELAPRIEIARIRGYQSQGRRAARIVGETEGIAPATTTPFDDALAVLGRHPADYSNKVDADITVGMPAGQAAGTILIRLLDTIEVNTPGVLRDIDIEFLHDLRVSVRRTRAALKLFGDALGDQADIARAAAEFKWLGDLTTPTRDLDVHLLGFDDMTASLRAAKPDDLEPFRAYLRERRAREFRALARGLRSPRYRELTREWRETLTAVRETDGRKTGAKARSEEFTAGTMAAERTRRAFVKVARRGGAITPDSPHESLHDLRKRCKELRYALEFFAPLYDPASYGKVVGDLKRLQDCLGAFQDSEVQIAEIQALAESMLEAGEAPAATLLAMGELTAGVAANQVAARNDFERRFAAFAGIEGQRRMSVLLRGGAE